MGVFIAFEVNLRAAATLPACECSIITMLYVAVIDGDRVPVTIRMFNENAHPKGP